MVQGFNEEVYLKEFLKTIKQLRKYTANVDIKFYYYFIPNNTFKINLNTLFGF